MRNTFTVLSLGAVLFMAGCSSSRMQSNSDNKAAADEWVSLFDGKTTNGWHTYGRSQPGAAWKVADGALYFDPTNRENGRIVGGGDLTTNEEYENFHLQLEWKVAPNANSGIIFLVNEDTAKYKASYATGPEMQVLDNNGHPDAKIHKHRAGDLYDLIASSQETVKPVGEWNKAEIRLDRGKLDLFLNGTNVVSTTMWDDNWNKLVEGSKFKGWPGFAKSRKGRIALQDHGDAVWYRNIRIRRL
ncbi:MAG TPA: DUF1080 domain-containing protein [Chitinophagaceae bacterium]|jgi:hypothetical protein|nr:DUF1080 domain-containing protein [Chitinophagaceae bacterium]